MPSYNHELATLESAVRQAGQRVLELVRDGFETYIKKDQSPVTTADLEVDRILKDILLKIYPDDGWLSEETPDDGKRVDHPRVWVLDPIDGTKYFTLGIPQYAISIALVEQGEPVIGAIFNPATDEYFSAVRGMGATLNGHLIHVRSASSNRLTLLVNPPALERKPIKLLEDVADCQPMGSIAYTLALVAAGRADATINLGTQNEWDVAAGTILVQEAGGTAVDKHWNAIRFNNPIPSVPGIIAARTDAQEEIQKLLHILSPNTVSKPA